MTQIVQFLCFQNLPLSEQNPVRKCLLVNERKPPSFTGLVQGRMAHLLLPFMCPRCSNLMATHVRYLAPTANEIQPMNFLQLCDRMCKVKTGARGNFAKRVL